MKIRLAIRDSESAPGCGHCRSRLLAGSRWGLGLDPDSGSGDRCTQMFVDKRPKTVRLLNCRPTTGKVIQSMSAWVTDASTSARMRRVRRAATIPEQGVQAALRHQKVRFTVTPATVVGTPDLCSRKGHWAIFVHGCFWHRHPGCKRTTLPRRNREAWQRKFARNQSRDRRVVRALKLAGFKVLVIWECQTADVDGLASRVQQFIDGTKPHVQQRRLHSRSTHA